MTWKTVLTCVRSKAHVPILVFDKVGGVSERIAKFIKDETDLWLKTFGNLTGPWQLPAGGVGLMGGPSASTGNPRDSKRMTEKELTELANLKEIWSEGGDRIEVIDPTTTTLDEVEAKIMKLAALLDLHPSEDKATVKGDLEIVLPQHISMIHHLDLSGNSIGDAGIQVFARYLEHNSSIVGVDLRHNVITDAGALYLAKALVRNTTLTSLFLTDNLITKKGERLLDSVVFARGFPCAFEEDKVMLVHEESIGEMMKVSAAMQPKQSAAAATSSPALGSVSPSSTRSFRRQSVTGTPGARRMSVTGGQKTSHPSLAVASQGFRGSAASLASNSSAAPKEKVKLSALRRKKDVVKEEEPEFGVGVAVQLHAIPAYTRWRAELSENITRDSELRILYPEPLEFEEFRLNLIAWPLHSSVRYPALCKKFLAEVVSLTMVRPNLRFISDVPDFNGNTILHRACEHGYVESVVGVIQTPRIVLKNQLKVRDITGATVYESALRQLKQSHDNMEKVTEKETSEEEYKDATAKVEIAEEIIGELNSNRMVQEYRKGCARKFFFKQMFSYLIFLAIGTMVTLNSTVGWTGERLQVREAIKSALTEQQATPDAYYSVSTFLSFPLLSFVFSFPFTQDFTGIGSLDDFWNFVNIPFISALWPESSFTNSFFLQSESRIVGAVRMRQQRVKSRDCDLPTAFDSFIFGGSDGECYPSLQVFGESHLPFTTDLDLSSFNLTNDGTVWKSGGELGYKDNFKTRLSTSSIQYDGSGFVIDIPSGDLTTAVAILAAIQNSDWISRETRAIFLEATFFNANLNTMVFGMMAVELPPASGATPSRFFIPFPAERYPLKKAEDIVFFILEMIFLIMALWSLVQESNQSLLLLPLPIVQLQFIA